MRFSRRKTGRFWEVKGNFWLIYYIIQKKLFWGRFVSLLKSFLLLCLASLMVSSICLSSGFTKFCIAFIVCLNGSFRSGKGSWNSPSSDNPKSSLSSLSDVSAYLVFLFFFTSLSSYRASYPFSFKYSSKISFSFLATLLLSGSINHRPYSLDDFFIFISLDESALFWRGF